MHQSAAAAGRLLGPSESSDRLGSTSCHRVVVQLKHLDTEKVGVGLLASSSSSSSFFFFQGFIQHLHVLCQERRHSPSAKEVETVRLCRRWVAAF